MKKIIPLLFLVLLSSFSAFARELTVTHKAVIETVNLEDQTLNIVGVTYKLAPETRVLTQKGQLLSVYALRKGTVIEFILNNTEPDKKIITQIKILSDVPKELTEH
jgi:fructose-1,6-bisphosphatase